MPLTRKLERERNLAGLALADFDETDGEDVEFVVGALEPVECLEDIGPACGKRAVRKSDAPKAVPPFAARCAGARRELAIRPELACEPDEIELRRFHLRICEAHRPTRFEGGESVGSGVLGEGVWRPSAVCETNWMASDERRIRQGSCPGKAARCEG